MCDLRLVEEGEGGEEVWERCWWCIAEEMGLVWLVVRMDVRAAGYFQLDVGAAWVQPILEVADVEVFKLEVVGGEPLSMVKFEDECFEILRRRGNGVL